MPTQREKEKALNQLLTSKEQVLLDETSRLVDRVDTTNVTLENLTQSVENIPKEIQKVEVINQSQPVEEVEILNFPQIQRVEVLNFPPEKDPVAPIVNIAPAQVHVAPPIVEVQPADVFFPEEVKAEVLNFPDIQKVHLVDAKGKPAVIQPIVNVPPQNISPFNYGGHIDTVKVNNSTANPVNVNIVSGSTGGGSSGGIGDNTVTVTTAGTRVQLGSQSITRVIIQAHESNTGTLVVGGSTVVAALVGRRGIALYPTQSEVFTITNTNLLYIDSTANGDKVNYTYET